MHTLQTGGKDARSYLATDLWYRVALRNWLHHEPVHRSAGLSRQSGIGGGSRSEEHTSELQSLMRISYAVFCLKKKKKNKYINDNNRIKKQQQNDTHNITHKMRHYYTHTPTR